MKKALILTLFALVVFTAYAQGIDKDRYVGITYDDFMAWLNTGTGTERFKMYLKYDGPSSPGYNFKDENDDLILVSEADLDFEPGQGVVVYFTASGPLVWDRSIDAVERDDDSRLASSPVVSSTDRVSSNQGPQSALVPSSPRVPNSGSAQVLLPPETDRVIIEINREANGNIRLSIEPGGTPPPRNAYPPNPGRSPAVPSPKTTAVPESTASLPVKVIPRLPAAGDRKVYKVQVGAFVNEIGAVRLFQTLSDAGLSPVHEKFGNWNRVLISGVPGSEVSALVRRLSSFGIKTVWLRE
jgi:cell division septation protein DedD